ncbi:MAG: hypothetical protein J7642_21190 [Cyanobacteria bacterium SBC]|nr:hypothetical protein [Cyanobacteria bacterium SBC]
MDNTEILEQLTTTIEALQQSAAALRQAIEAIRAESEFVSVAEAAERLNTSVRWVRAQIAKGWWKHGREYRDTSNGDRPNYQICVAAVRRWLETPPEKRVKPRRR